MAKDISTDEQIALLMKEVAELKLGMAQEVLARTEAEERAHALSSLGRYSGDRSEQPSGNVAQMNVCTNPWERKESKQKWKNVDVPLYFYTIDLPKGAWSISRNGIEYAHGQTYEVDIDTLRDLKSGVWGCWKHEYDIHGNNENEYRPQAPVNLRGAH